ncbi:MAG: LLM class flavin-dependent oxidoreductase [Chloroflexota bacterium]|nr:LLM class flavin-dependent oxidoreductase [Chloroflexota bacterium]
MNPDANPKLRFGILTMPIPPWNGLVARWRDYEELGFDSLWVCDHFTAAVDDAPLYEAWTTLAGMAAATSRIRLGTLVTCGTFRHPALLAKEIVTVDHLSAGRLEIGLGAGWWAEEHVRFGFPFGAPIERFARFAETVEVLDLLLRGDPCDYNGEYVQLSGARAAPTALQVPRPPLMIAAQSPRMLRLAARYADSWIASFGLSPEDVAQRCAVLDDACLTLGRDPVSVRRAFLWAPWVQRLDPWATTDSFNSYVTAYRAAGITDFYFDEPRPDQRSRFEAIIAGPIANLREFGG